MSRLMSVMLGHYALNGELLEVLLVECVEPGCKRRSEYTHHLGAFGEDRLPEAEARAIFEKQGWTLGPPRCSRHRTKVLQPGHKR